MKALCSRAPLPVGICICMSPDTRRRSESRSLRFNPSESQVDKKWGCCCCKFPNGGLLSLRTRETETMQTGNAGRRRVCKVCLKETGPYVAITKLGVSDTTDERPYG